eukprot:4853553-Karenia_brevis.AAC.1
MIGDKGMRGFPQNALPQCKMLDLSGNQIARTPAPAPAPAVPPALAPAPAPAPVFAPAADPA